MKINPLERIQFSRRKILESKNFTSCIETNLKYDVKLIKKKIQSPLESKNRSLL